MNPVVKSGLRSAREEFREIGVGDAQLFCDAITNLSTCVVSSVREDLEDREHQALEVGDSHHLRA
jgi:hypothetical protein